MNTEKGMRMEEYIEEDQLPHRRSIRLSHHNYQWSASYFVTIRSNHHEPIFEMPELHAIVEETWKRLPERFTWISLDSYIVMPDHFHGILHFLITDMPALSLGRVIGAYKSITTVEWLRYVKAHNVYWSALSCSLVY